MSVFLHVKNLLAGTTRDSLSEMFAAHGPVEDAIIITPLDAKQPAGIVMMANEADAARAVEQLHDHEIAENQRLAVTEASEKQTARLQSDERRLARELARELGETQEMPLRQIEMMLRHTNLETVQTIYQETLQIEAQGGMQIKDGSRRRTLGGVFFFLANKRLPSSIRKKVFPHFKTVGQSAEGSELTDAPKKVAAPTLPAFKWEARGELFEVLVQQKGVATTMKMTLVGRPGKIQQTSDVVITTMEYTSKAPLPKGLPNPPPTRYMIYIGSKQWRKVSDAIQDPEDALIIEGMGFYDPKFAGISVVATMVTTKVLQRARRESDQGKSASGGEEASAPESKPESRPPAAPKPATPQAARQTQPALKPIAPPPPKPKLDPAELMRRLATLNEAEDEARNQLDAIKALPPDEQLGLTEALQRLQRIKAEIKALQQG